MGILTEEKGKTHPERHILTQYLGIFPKEMVVETFQAGPVTLMNSDVFFFAVMVYQTWLVIAKSKQW